MIAHVQRVAARRPALADRLSAFFARWWVPLAAGLIALITLVWQTWPTYSDPADYAMSGPGDAWGGTAVIQATVEEGLNPFAPGVISAFNAPDGFPIGWQVNLQQWPSSVLQFGVTWLTGDGEIAYNLYVLIGVVLSAMTMAWLLLRLTGDRAVALLFGVAITLLPMMIFKRGGHPTLIHLWPMILMAITVHAVYVQPTVKRALLAGIVAFVALSWSGYHLLLAGVTLVALLVGFGVASLRGPERGRRFRAFGIVVGVPILGLGALGVLLSVIGQGADPTSEVRANPKEALYAYGARWYEYVVPTSRSLLFGDETGPWLTERIHGSNGIETPLYLGVSVILLGIVGIILTLRDRERPHRAALLTCGALVAFAGLWVSLPPTVTVFGQSVPTPSDFIFQVFTTWRVYSRLAAVVAVGLFVLAAVGLSALAGRRPGIRRYAVLAVAATVIVGDLWTRAEPVTAIVPPQVATVVRDLPPGTIAQYPLGRGENDGYGVLYNQQYYGDHPVVNGFDDQDEEPRAASLANLADPRTPERLAALGVRYALVVRRPLMGSESEPLPERLPRGFRRIATGMQGPWPAEIYEVVRRPGTVEAFPGVGFIAPDGIPPNVGQWMADEATLDVWGVCRVRCRGALTFDALSLGAPRTVEILEGKRRVARFKVGERRPVRVPLAVRNGNTPLTVRVTPGARPVNEVIIGSGDTRPLSVRFENLDWRPAGRRSADG